MLPRTTGERSQLQRLQQLYAVSERIRHIAAAVPRKFIIVNDGVLLGDQLPPKKGQLADLESNVGLHCRTEGLINTEM